MNIISTICHLEREFFFFKCAPFQVSFSIYLYCSHIKEEQRYTYIYFKYNSGPLSRFLLLLFPNVFRQRHVDKKIVAYWAEGVMFFTDVTALSAFLAVKNFPWLPTNIKPQ